MRNASDSVIRITRTFPRNISRAPAYASLNSLTMKTNLLSRSTGAFFLGALVILSANLSFAADKTRPRTHTRTGTYQNSNGKSGTFSSSTTRSQGELQREGSWTNVDGKTGTREATRSWDKSTGTGTTSARVTTPAGKTVSRDGTLNKTADGAVQSQGTIAGARGNTSTYATTTTRSENGSTTTGTVTGPKGRETQVNRSTQKTDEGERQRTTSVTGPNGRNSERVVSTKINGDGTGTRTLEYTKADGTTGTRTETFTVTSRTVTPAAPAESPLP